MKLTLTREQRAALFAGDPVRLTFDGKKPCPVKAGHIEVLSAHVRLEVTGIRRTRDGDHTLVYTLHNNRLGQRFLARHGDELGYSHVGPSDVDCEAGEAVDDFTQKRITRESRDREQREIGELLAAMEDVREALDERIRQRPEAAKIIGRELWQLRGRIDAAKARLKRRMAA